MEKMLDTDDRRLIINISDVGPLGNNAQTEYHTFYDFNS